MNHRPLSLKAFGLLLATAISLPVAVRADDASMTAPAANTTAPSAQPPLAKPTVVSPSPTASGDATPAAPAPVAANPDTYTVVSGDTLWGIAHKFSTSIKKLKKLNGLKTSHLKPGQVLKIPAATDATTEAK